jgi:hypothetical protein
MPISRRYRVRPHSTRLAPKSVVLPTGEPVALVPGRNLLRSRKRLAPVVTSMKRAGPTMYQTRRPDRRSQRAPSPRTNAASNWFAVANKLHKVMMPLEKENQSISATAMPELTQ